MSRPSVVLAVWAALLAVLAVVLFTIFGARSYLSYVLPGFAVASTLGMALAALPRGRGQRSTESGPEWEAVPDLSLATSLVAVALSLMLVGAQVGTWLLLIGAGLLVLGAGGLVRELRAGRRVGPPARGGSGAGEPAEDTG